MAFCAKCGTQTIETEQFCKSCGATTVATAAPQAIHNDAVGKLSTRYQDGYRHAMVLVGLGTTIKIVGLVVGGLIALGGFSLSGNSGGFGGMGGFNESLLIASVIAGVIMAGLFFVVGVLVSSQGQVLRATLGSAVNNSPLLSNPDRIAIMGL
jgi:uncharacterized membrane protein YvbJ